MEIRKIGVLGAGTIGSGVAPLNGESGEFYIPEGEFVKRALPRFFGLPSWEKLEEAMEGAYSLEINPLPQLREALRKMGLSNWKVLFLPSGGMPTPAHLPCIGVRLELDPWQDEETGDQYYNRLVTLHIFTEEWAPLLLGDDGVPEV